MARTGRPRAFDRAAAIRAALHLFWAHGYATTSLDELKRAMGGISTASFYAAFGSKEALFREVVALYRATFGQVTGPLRDASLAPRDAVEQALRGSARMQTDPLHPSGCLVALAASTCSRADAPLRAELAAEREANRQAFRACIDRAIASGELGAGTDPVALATLLDGVLVGFSIQARDGVAPAALQAAVTGALRLWDLELAAAAPGTRERGARTAPSVLRTTPQPAPHDAPSVLRTTPPACSARLPWNPSHDG